MSAATVVRPTREHVEALALAASLTSHARAIATLAARGFGVDFLDDPRYIEAVAADEAAQNALRAVLDATFTELEQLRAEAGR